MDSPEKEITGYLHNVSPIKQTSELRYFEMQIQTKEKILRGVCFSQSNDKRDEFHTLSMMKSPVKIGNFNTDEEQDLTSVLMRNNAIAEKIW